MLPSSPLSSAEPALELRCALPLTRGELAARIDAALAAAAEKVVRETVADEQVISLAEATAMTPWTESGFKRVATRENLAFVKGPHKSPPGYRRGDVVGMLRRLRVWPAGRPAEVLDFHTPGATRAA